MDFINFKKAYDAVYFWNAIADNNISVSSAYSSSVMDIRSSKWVRRTLFCTACIQYVRVRFKLSDHLLRGRSVLLNISSLGLNSMIPLVCHYFKIPWKSQLGWLHQISSNSDFSDSLFSRFQGLDSIGQAGHTGWIPSSLFSYSLSEDLTVCVHHTWFLWVFYQNPRIYYSNCRREPFIYGNRKKESISQG